MGEGRTLCADGVHPMGERELFAQSSLFSSWEKGGFFAQSSLSLRYTLRYTMVHIQYVHPEVPTQGGI